MKILIDEFVNLKNHMKSKQVSLSTPVATTTTTNASFKIQPGGVLEALALPVQDEKNRAALKLDLNGRCYMAVLNCVNEDETFAPKQEQQQQQQTTETSSPDILILNTSPSCASST